MPYKYDPETGLILNWKAIPEFMGDYTVAPSGTIVENSAYTNTSTNLLYQYQSGAWTAIYQISAIAPPAITAGSPMGLTLVFLYSYS